MRQFTDLGINPFEVKLIGLNHPLAKAVIDYLAKQRAPLPTWIDGVRLGDIYIESAYIYNGSEHRGLTLMRYCVDDSSAAAGIAAVGCVCVIFRVARCL